MADLPTDRTDPSPPFSFWGMDCFGPFITKNHRKENKRYGLLLTCLCSRAIHLELLDSLDTDSFITALRCFISIRGTVSILRSDQGTNFVGARNEFNSSMKELDVDRLQTFLASKQCTFTFNTPSASHAGGVWERQIGSVLKHTLSLCPGRLDDTSLRCMLYETMSIVNSRPLTVLSNDPTEDPFTPNHLITIKPTLPLPPPGHFVREDLFARKRWRRIQYLCEQFWSKWRKQYLLNMNERQKWLHPKRNLKVGDVVLLLDAVSPRNNWPLGVVDKTHPSSDGLVRRVTVRVGTSDLDKDGKRKSKTSLLERPIQKLIVLLESSNN